MSEITFDRKTISEVFQIRYSLPSYQREYKWNEKQLGELLTDLQDAFNDNYDSSHARSEIAKYKEYFLGTIITTQSSAGIKEIIDGQQRLTTIVLLLAYFHRIKATRSEEKFADVESLIRREMYGKKDYNIFFQESKTALFDIILNLDIQDEEIYANFESIQNKDIGTIRLFDLYTKIENYLNSEIKQELLPYFVDYVIHKVMLFNIGVPSEQDAHRVFVTMNDRGLKLAPVDLLKGYLLSNISDDQANIEAHQKWSESINLLNQVGPEEDSQFIKTMLRALYADTIRGKKKGDNPGDFDVIGDSYHRWVVDNRTKLNLNNGDDFQNFVSDFFPKYTKIYKKIKDGETNYSQNNRHLFYNGCKNLTLQSMVILSSIKPNDTEPIINRKIKVVSAYLDLFLTSRVITSQDNTYDNVRDPLFALTKKIRNQEIDDIKKTLSAEAKDALIQIENIGSVKYEEVKRQDVLHILARLADFLERECNQTNTVSFPIYVNRELGSKTFDIEHILTSTSVNNKTAYGKDWDFPKDADYNETRNTLGALILLPRGRNRSLKNKSYPDKINVYSTENILAQTLSESFYENNPTVREAFSSLALPVNAPKVFNMYEFQKRSELYKSIAKLIWNNSTIEDV